MFEEWNVFKNRGLHFIHLNINSSLSKNEELGFVAKPNNAAVVRICESKADASVFEQEISIDNHKILRCDRNRHSVRVACYIRNDLSYNILSVFPCGIENIFLEILLPNSKPVIVGTIYHPLSQNSFLKLLCSNMNTINPVDNEIYILGDFNIKSGLNDSYILEKKNILNTKSIPSDIKRFYCKSINKGPNNDQNQ